MYKSGGPATADLLGDHIDVCDLGTGTAGFQAARKGDLIIIANLGTAEVPFFPDVPKLRDMGAPFATSLMYGFAFPNGTPEVIRLKWEQAWPRSCRTRSSWTRCTPQALPLLSSTARNTGNFPVTPPSPCRRC